MRLLRLTVVAVVSLGCGGGGSQQGEPASAAKVATISCPSLTAETSNIAAAFGVDPTLAARLERTLRLADALKASAADLARQASEICGALTLDLKGVVGPNEHACTALGRRTRELRQSLGGGFKVSVSGVSCSLPDDAMEACAGECLTGQAGVISAVQCRSASAGTCALDFALPNASRECAARCGALALTRVACSAQVQIQLGTTETTPTELLGVAEALQRDLPKLYGLVGSIAPRSAALAAESTAVVDDLATSIDSLSSGKATLDRQAVVGVVLAGCVAPRLAEVVQSSGALRQALGAAAEAQAALNGT